MARRFTDAWNKGDLEWILDHQAPEFEFHPTGQFADNAPVYRGREGYTEFWKTFRDAWESITVEVERIEDLGDRVLVLFTFHGKGRGSGVEVDLNRATLVTIREGRMLQMRTFADWSEALEAAGLQD
jgi:ketosteroid isomerase-like protein